MQRRRAEALKRILVHEILTPEKLYQLPLSVPRESLLSISPSKYSYMKQSLACYNEGTELTDALKLFKAMTEEINTDLL